MFGAWSVLVPAYFWKERWDVSSGKVTLTPTRKAEVLEEIKTDADYLRNVWAGVIAVLAAIIFTGPSS